MNLLGSPPYTHCTRPLLRRGLSGGLACAVATLGLLAPVDDASALEPATSTLVDSVTIGDVYGALDADSDATLLVGIDGCDRALSLSGDIMITFNAVSGQDFSTTPTLGGLGYENVYYFSNTIDGGSSPSCVGSATCNTVNSGNITRASSNVVVNMPFNTLTTLSTSSECLTAATELDFFVRLQFEDTVTSSTDEADARIRVDLVRPEPPATFDAVVTEDAIELTWTDGPSGDVESYRIIYQSEQFEGGVFSDELSSASRTTVASTTTNRSNVSIDNLEPGTTVWLAVASVDRVGNESVLSAAQPYTVIDTIGFWDVYKEGGGAETGGYCSAAPLATNSKAPTGLLLLCGLFFLGCGVQRTRQHGA